MSQEEVGFVGGGRIVRQLLLGWKHADFTPRRVRVFEPDPEVVEVLMAAMPGLEIARNSSEAIAGATVVFLAVHPPQLLCCVSEISQDVSAQSLVISLAPKLTLGQISSRLPPEIRVARLLPNSPSLLGEGYNPFVCGANWTGDDRARLCRMLEAWGESPEVPEAELEAFAVLTAMGPTYFWFQWQALEDLAREFGLADARIRPALKQMLLGATRVYFESGLTPKDVIDLIPVRPLREQEDPIRRMFEEQLTAVYRKIKP